MSNRVTAIGVSKDSFERHILGELRVLRVGCRTVIPLKELERYVERNASRPLEAELGELIK